VELVVRDLRVTREKVVGWQHMRTELGTINEQLHERITRLLESNNQLSDRVYGLQAERADLVKAHQQEKDEMTRAHQEKVDYLSAARSVIADTVGAASVDYGDMLEAVRSLRLRAETYQRGEALAWKLVGWLCFALVSGVIAVAAQVLG
jgi:FtsZ-binding cell division protein ZapB